MARKPHSAATIAALYVLNLARRSGARGDRLVLGERHPIGARTVAGIAWWRRGGTAQFATLASDRFVNGFFGQGRDSARHLDGLQLDGARAAKRRDASRSGARGESGISVLRQDHH